MKVRAVICDIEGTTSSISFVHRVMFPLSLEKLDSYLESNAGNAELERELAKLKVTPEKYSETLKDFIRRDVKDPTLKWIQGKIWKDAFEDGSIKGHVYPEVPGCFRRWKDSGAKIYIYSSGSVEAQELLFRYSEAGDLTQYLDGYFDTSTGMKKENASYARILAAIACKAQDVLFLSDIVGELNAAASQGINTCLLLREGMQAPEGYAGSIAADFHEVHTRFF